MLDHKRMGKETQLTGWDAASPKHLESEFTEKLQIRVTKPEFFSEKLTNCGDSYTIQ